MRIAASICAAIVPLIAVSGALAQSAPARPAAAQQPPNTSVAQAKTDTAADMTTATFGDWQLRCRAGVPASANQPAVLRSCEVVQSVIIQGQTAPFAQLAFGKPEPSAPLHFTAVLPTNVSFPSTVKIMQDEKDKQPVELAWTRCLPGGCFASIATKDDFLKRWRAQEEAGRFVFRNSAGQEMAIPFSFRGLGRALDALAKEG